MKANASKRTLFITVGAIVVVGIGGYAGLSSMAQAKAEDTYNELKSELEKNDKSLRISKESISAGVLSQSARVENLKINSNYSGNPLELSADSIRIKASSEKLSSLIGEGVDISYTERQSSLSVKTVSIEDLTYEDAQLIADVIAGRASEEEIISGIKNLHTGPVKLAGIKMRESVNRADIEKLGFESIEEGNLYGFGIENGTFSATRVGGKEVYSIEDARLGAASLLTALGVASNPPEDTTKVADSFVKGFEYTDGDIVFGVDNASFDDVESVDGKMTAGTINVGGISITKPDPLPEGWSQSAAADIFNFFESERVDMRYSSSMDIDPETGQFDLVLEGSVDNAGSMNVSVSVASYPFEQVSSMETNPQNPLAPVIIGFQQSDGLEGLSFTYEDEGIIERVIEQSGGREAIAAQTGAMINGFGSMFNFDDRQMLIRGINDFLEGRERFHLELSPDSPKTLVELQQIIGTGSRLSQEAGFDVQGR